MTDPELHGDGLGIGAAPRQRGEIGRTVGDMHALEQTVAGELLGCLA